MCTHGDTVSVRVSNGDARSWHFEDIDRCIAPLIEALNAARIYTASCCCGHGEEHGYIWLRDGRALIVLNEATKEAITEMARKAVHATSE